MKKIIRPRRSGKTSELIRISEQTGAYIVTATRGRADIISQIAKEQEKRIPFPITLAEYLHSRLRGSYIKHILIDDADGLLLELFKGFQIDVITITYPDPWEIAECEVCETLKSEALCELEAKNGQNKI